MKKILLISACLLFISVIANAQSAAKAVYAELGGAGIASINYDMRLQQKNDGLGFRVGVGGFSIKFDDGNNNSERSGLLTVPLELNYLLGKDDKHFFEFGAGATFVSISNKSSNVDISNDQFSSTFGHLYLGYRLQPAEGGFVFRAGITPVFGKGYFIPYYAGISFGYKF